MAAQTTAGDIQQDPGVGCKPGKEEVDLTLHPGAASRPPAELPRRSPDSPSVLLLAPLPAWVRDSALSGVSGEKPGAWAADALAAPQQAG